MAKRTIEQVAALYQMFANDLNRLVHTPRARGHIQRRSLEGIKADLNYHLDELEKEAAKLGYDIKNTKSE